MTAPERPATADVRAAVYEERILKDLVERYRKSKKDTGTNLVDRATRTTPERAYKNYYRNDGDIDEIESVNLAAARCQELGFVSVTMKPFSNEIAHIALVDERVEEAERYLTERYGYESKSSQRHYVEGMIAAYSGRSPAADRECAKLQEALDKNRIPPKYLVTEDILKALVFIERNDKDLFLREASMLIYGDSKYLEGDKVLGGVSRALRSYLDAPCGEDELEDEILGRYHITKERQKICLKGNVILKIGGRELDLGLLSAGAEIFADELEDITEICVRAPVFMTVENYASWLRMHGPDMALFYLGGYTTRYQRDFLKKVYADCPDLDYRHFGDIDAGGLYIHEHLCRVTGIPFQMYRMSVEELEDPRFQSCLHGLTDTDRNKLTSLSEQEPYREVAAYMLEHDVKLEQEIVSYFE